MRIPVAQLEIGMRVVELDRPWLETPFLLQGFVVETEADLLAVRQYCRSVTVELQHPYPQVVSSERPARGDQRKGSKPNRTAKSEQSSAGGLLRLLRREPAASGQKPVVEQLQAAMPAHRQTSRLLRSLMDDVRLGNAINATSARMQVRECVETVLENPDAMMWLAQLKAKDERSSSHSLNACILAVTFGRHLGVAREMLESLGLAALLHDVGKILLPASLLNKRDNLSADDEAFLRQHTEFGRRVLMNARGMPGIAIDVAYDHHEQLDGNGYPRGLSGEQIPPIARMVAVIDVFEALTSTHYYRDALPQVAATAKLRSLAGNQLDAEYVSAFVAMIGAFPVGSLAELSNGCIGVVITSNRQQPEAPKVLVLRGSDRLPCREQILDLADPAAPRIAQLLPDGECGIDIQALLRKGLRLRVE